MHREDVPQQGLLGSNPGAGPHGTQHPTPPCGASRTPNTQSVLPRPLNGTRLGDCEIDLLVTVVCAWCDTPTLGVITTNSSAVTAAGTSVQATPGLSSRRPPWTGEASPDTSVSAMAARRTSCRDGCNEEDGSGDGNWRRSWSTDRRLASPDTSDCALARTTAGERAKANLRNAPSTRSERQQPKTRHTTHNATLTRNSSDTDDANTTETR